MQVEVFTRDQVVALINTDAAAVATAILGLYARQTHDEQVSAETTDANGRGFNFRDAPFLTSLARALPLWRNHMTPKQLVAARRILPKYARQIAEIFGERGIAPPAREIVDPNFGRFA